MQRPWQDLGLWALGVVVMLLGVGFPIYLLHSEGSDSLFGNIVYVLSGIFLFLAGLGILFFRSWLTENQKLTAQDPARP